jgi:outer membrane protein
MKTIVKIIAAVTLVFGLSNSACAQKGKVGYINTNDLLMAMPERTEAEKAIQQEAQNLEGQIVAMQTELQTKYGEYQAQSGTMSDIIRQTKEAELQDLQTRIQNFQGQAQESLQVREGELMQPLIDKATEAIKTVATANGFSVVNDLATGVFLVYPEEDNILPLVKKHLGITIP